MSKREHDIPLSYTKLYYLIEHNIERLKRITDAIEDDTMYYVLHDPDTLRDHRDLVGKIEEWEEMKDILENKLEILIFD